MCLTIFCTLFMVHNTKCCTFAQIQNTKCVHLNIYYMKYRIIEQIESKGLSVTEFVEKMGWKQRSSFYNIVNGNPTIPVLE